jgi:glutamine synthetase
MFWLEYIWLDSDNNFRSKIKIVNTKPKSITDVPLWNYDGSSTGQATVNNSEVTLRPIKIYNDKENYDMVYILCETLNQNYIRYESDYIPDNGSYISAKNIFDKYKDEEPMFGIEQEFFMYDENNSIPEIELQKSGKYYCSNGLTCSRTRPYLEEVLEMCIKVGIKVTGLNYEVAPGQAELQVCNIGIDACTDLLMLRFFLVRIGEEYNVVPDFEPKPIKTENGSGCHINFSTKSLRECVNKEKRINMVNDMCSKLEKTHDIFIETFYGEGNKERLSGTCETSDYRHFSVGSGSRSVSIRPESNYYYFEDRRPSSNINPYLACSKLLYHIMK